MEIAKAHVDSSSRGLQRERAAKRRTENWPAKKDFTTRKLCLKVRIQTDDPPTRKNKRSKKAKTTCENQGNGD